MPTVSFVKAPSGIIYATVAGYAACARIEREGPGKWAVKWTFPNGSSLSYKTTTRKLAKRLIAGQFDLWETNRAASGALLGR